MTLLFIYISSNDLVNTDKHMCMHAHACVSDWRIKCVFYPRLPQKGWGKKMAARCCSQSPNGTVVNWPLSCLADIRTLRSPGWCSVHGEPSPPSGWHLLTSQALIYPASLTGPILSSPLWAPSFRLATLRILWWSFLSSSVLSLDP